MDKCTFCAGGPDISKANTPEQYAQYGSNRLVEGKLPLCAEMCSTHSLLAGDGAIIGEIYKERVLQARLRLRRLGLVHRLYATIRKSGAPDARAACAPWPLVLALGWRTAWATPGAQQPAHS